jgi:thiamine biosynthesis lipoprotein
MLSLTLCLSGCTPAPEVYQHSFTRFGTTIELSLSGVTEAQAATANAALEADFALLHEAWHAWEPGSLTRVNTLLPSGARFTVSLSVLPLITQSQTFARQSEGLFNPALGKLYALWGFHKNDPSQHQPPDSAMIKALLTANPQMQDIQVDGIFLRCLNPAVQLDFGGIAKGYATDLALIRLRGLGIHNAIVNAGGNLKAMGRHGTRPWRIGIRDPHTPARVIAWLDLEGDEAVMTSGGYERFFMYQGKRYAHIIDPRSGAPATGTGSATVVHPDGATADAAATALFVAGVRDWARIARQMGVTQALLFDDAGVAHVTPALAARLHFTDPAPQIQLTPLP